MIPRALILIAQPCARKNRPAMNVPGRFTKEEGQLMQPATLHSDRTITLKHVAALAGVSPITVSRALNKPDTVSAKLRDKVQRAVEVLGYVQNHVAGALASAGSNVIPVVVPSLSNTVFIEVVAGIQEVAQKAGYQLMLGNTEYDLEREYELISTFLGWSPPGLIIAGMRHLERTRSLLKRWGKPVVETMEYGAQPVDMNVGLSHYQAGEVMARHLVERGYRQIAFVGCQLKADYRAWQRYKGMDRVLAKSGLTRRPPIAMEQASSAMLGGDALLQALELHPELDAIFFANDDLAVGAILRAQREGIAVPKRVAIAGFNGLGLAELVQPTLTTIASPRLEIGRIAAQQLLDQLNGRPPRRRRVDVSFELATRQST
jgi:LacI family gluconate utilization system Gnt-I transcriptional repressor